MTGSSQAAKHEWLLTRGKTIQEAVTSCCLRMCFRKITDQRMKKKAFWLSYDLTEHVTKALLHANYCTNYLQQKQEFG